MSFTYAELFAGVLGFGTALDELGGQPVFISEIDKFAQQAIRALGRGNLLHGDITKIEASAVPDHDLLVGGFPCQAFSVAGRKLGFEDMRGTLFFEAVRIAKEKRPKVLFLENVGGLASHAKGETLSVMLHSLNEIGYLVDFSILDSKFFDVPQERKRLYIVAVRDDIAQPAQWPDMQGPGYLAERKARLCAEGLKTFSFEWPEQDTITEKRLRDVLEPEVDEKYFLPYDRIENFINELIAKKADGSFRAIREAPDNRIRMLGRIALKGPDIIKRVYDPNALASTITAMGGGHRQPKIILQQGPDGAFYPMPGEETPGFAENYRIRKLTPLECWRLQGFSDEAFYKVKASGLSDSQLYKQAGNAVTVNTVRAIAEKLLPFLHVKKFEGMAAPN